MRSNSGQGQTPKNNSKRKRNRCVCCVSSNWWTNEQIQIAQHSYSASDRTNRNALNPNRSKRKSTTKTIEIEGKERIVHNWGFSIQLLPKCLNVCNQLTQSRAMMYIHRQHCKERCLGLLIQTKQTHPFRVHICCLLKRQDSYASRFNIQTLNHQEKPHAKGSEKGCTMKNKTMEKSKMDSSPEAKPLCMQRVSQGHNWSNTKRSAHGSRQISMERNKNRLEPKDTKQSPRENQPLKLKFKENMHCRLLRVFDSALIKALPHLHSIDTQMC